MSTNCITRYKFNGSYKKNEEVHDVVIRAFGPQWGGINFKSLQTLNQDHDPESGMVITKNNPFGDETKTTVRIRMLVTLKKLL